MARRSMSRLPIPDGPEGLTAEWLTEALRIGGAIGDSSVASIRVDFAGVRKGLLGRLARVVLEYSRAERGAPRTVIAKFHAAEPDLRSFVAEANLTEIRFYEEVAPRVRLRTPRRYYSAIDASSGECVLLLEDLGRLRTVDEIEGCTADEAAAVARRLGEFHATWWDSPDLDRLDWLKPFDQSFSVELIGRPARDFSGPLPEPIEELGRRLKDRYLDLFKMQSGPPRTIALNDVKARHLFFLEAEHGIDFAIVDFQLAVQARGVLDLARFFAGSLPLELRRRVELELLKVYHATLEANGVAGYGFEECFDDYRLGHLQNLVDYMAVEAQDLQKRGGPRAVQIQRLQLERYVAAILDLDCADLLPA